MNLLIVDDHATNLRLLRAQLEAGGHTVFEAANGIEALQVLEREKSVEGVVSDILMPNMDGFRLCLEIRKSRTFSELPFIVYTSTYDSPEDRQLAQSVGADHYLTKPAPVAEILGALHEAAQRTRPRIAALAARQDESHVLKQYNVSLVRKLEERNIEVEKALKNLQTGHDELRQSESLKGAILESSLDSLITIDDEGKIVEFNPAAEAAFGLTREQALGKVMVDLIVPPRLRDAHRQGFAHFLATGIGPILGKRLELEAVRADGTEFPIELTITAIGATSTPMFTGFIRDITAHKEADGKIKRLNRVYAVLSGINTLIVRVRDRGELFREACRIAVEDGNFGIAWIGSFDPATLDVTPVAWAGMGAQDFLSSTKSTAREDLPQGQGAVGRAIRELRPVLINDISAETSVGSVRRKEALARGYRSVIVLPLIVGGAAVGNLSLFAKELNFFDDEEVKLLAELAGDISFALENISRQQKLDKLARIRAVSSEINAAIVHARDPKSLFTKACRIAVEQGRMGSVWIGTLDPATLDITPVAWAGEGSEEMRTAKSTVRDDPPRGQGAVSRAARERRVIFNNDLAHQSFGGPRRDAVLKLGFRSMIALPLIESGKVVGTFTLYAREPGFFDEDEVALLTELAGNVSFALEHMARQQKLDKLARIRVVSSEINAASIRIRDRKALLEETCRIISEHGKFEMVWIGAIDHDEKKVQPIAWTGFSTESAHAVSWATIGAVQGPLDEAIRTRMAAVRDDIGEMPAGKLQQEALKKGCHSTVCLPLVVDDKAVALVSLYAFGRGFFDKDELALLAEVASDISFALLTIEKQKKLDYLSYYDPLTGLANRALFLERVAQYLRSAASGGHKLALFLIDVERFKNINDSLGQPAGDTLLKQVAEWLTHNYGHANLVARVGADHFAVVCPELKHEEVVARLVEKTLEAFLNHPFLLNDAVFRIAAKVGVALFPNDGDSADTLFRNAEAALKKAKASGERYLFYTQKMTESVAGKLTLENQLRQALDNEEFVLHYQPKVNLVSGKMTSAEALIRWNDPRTGLVPPGRFIPILEEIGLITEVGRWALRKALSDYLRWRAAGLPAVRIAVNVSPLQLRNRGFIDEIKQALGIDTHAAAGLELEITESLIMADVKHSIASLRAIRALGVTIAIDDFGTGFSSLSYLAKLPVDTLKIDRSFVVDMTAGPDGLALVSTIINLAHSLQLKVVAEGVETEEQSRLLRLLSCDEMQGYLFSKPVPVEIFESKFLAPLPAGTTARMELPAPAGSAGRPATIDIIL